MEKSPIDSGSIPDWNITYKQYAQGVERRVKLVTEAPEKVCVAESLDGFIRTTLSKSSMSDFISKSVFNALLATI